MSNGACTAAPAAPARLAATRLDAETVQLTWSDQSAVEDGYQIVFFTTWCFLACPGEFPVGCVEENNYCTWSTVLADLPPNATSFTVRNFSAPVSYGHDLVYVVAKKYGGLSDSSLVPWP